MSKKKIINTLVICLILINLFALGYFFMNKGAKKRHGPPPMQFVSEKLHFDADQIKEYHKAIERHRHKMELLRGEMEFAKKAMFENLATQGEYKDSLIANVAAIHLKIEENHYHHFQEIRKICRPDQVDDFNELSSQLAQLFAPHHPPKRRRGRKP